MLAFTIAVVFVAGILGGLCLAVAISYKIDEIEKRKAAKDRQLELVDNVDPAPSILKYS